MSFFMVNVLLLFGGKSCENEISILTGVFAYNLIDRAQFFPVPVYIHTDGKWYTSEKMGDLDTFKKGDFSSFERVIVSGGALYEWKEKKGGGKLVKKCEIGVALNCCHGGLGEGGGVSAAMALCDIPLASPDIAPSAVFLDKSLTKLLAKALGVPTVDYFKVGESDYQKRGAFLLKNIGTRLGFPVVVKPAKLGSSIGISVAENEEEAKLAIEAALLLDDCVLIEKFLKTKRDINCAAYTLNGEIILSEPEEAASGAGIYSFSDKYVKPKPKTAKKLPLSKETREKIRSYTRTLYKRVGFKGVVRMDFLLSEDKIYLGEVNTVPGSLAYYLFCERLTDAKAFFSDLIKEGLKKGEEKKILSTGVLRTVKGGAKRGNFAVRL